MMKYAQILTLFVLGLAGTNPASAADENGLIFSMAATEGCLQASADEARQNECVGSSASMCMDATPGGSSTYGMGGCLNYELEYWDDQLNAQYRVLMAREKADDAQADADGYSAPKKAPALRAMQRAWITYRDATCDYERAQWGGGTGGGPATLSCLLNLTGKQALALKRHLITY